MKKKLSFLTKNIIIASDHAGFELKKLINDVIIETDAVAMSDFGKVMPVVMQRSAGKADGKLVQSLVREKLS